MLNKDNIRELAYVVKIDEILPIEGADRVEQAVVGGWHIMTKKGQFKPGDAAIYFEIDSKVPETEPFEFLAAKHYKVKTQKYFKGTVISQGLLMGAEDFGWSVLCKEGSTDQIIVDDEGNWHSPNDESRFLTQKLGVKYAVDEDNVRKANSADKYKKMAQRHGKLFAKKPIRWLMKRSWGRKLLFVFFGKKKDKKNGWPAWVQKTDEERVQNMPWILKDKSEWIATEKVDGTSTTFSLKRGKGIKKNEFYICSRNVVFDKPDKNCYYDTNVYVEMAEKYHMEEVLTKLLEKFPCAEWVTIQGETYGAGIQKRDYSMKDHDFKAFNLIFSHTGRYDSITMRNVLEKEFNIPCVPIICEHFVLPNTVDELLNYVTGKSVIDGGMREGIVFRSKDGSKSFKAVSNEFLLKYHS